MTTSVCSVGQQDDEEDHPLARGGVYRSLSLSLLSLAWLRMVSFDW